MESGQKNKVLVVIPVFNEAGMIGEVIKELEQQGFRRILIVDDGSTDKTQEVVKGQKGAGITLIRHGINCGKGAAAKTGLSAAKKMDCEVIVTMDGDGQHDPQDIKALASPVLEEGFDVVLGSRLKKPGNMPLVRVWANKLGNLITWFFYKIKVTDSQSGFRAYSRSAAELINPRADYYDFDSEVLKEIKEKNLKFKEVPIKVRYSEYSLNKGHGQGIVNGLKTIYKMLWNVVN